MNPEKDFHYDHIASSYVFLGIGVILPIIGFIVKKKTTAEDIMNVRFQVRDQLIVFLVGVLFAIGLMMSGMTRRINILQFLWIGNSWNPQLLFVLGAGVVFNFITFQYMIRQRKNPLI